MHSVSVDEDNWRRPRRRWQRIDNRREEPEKTHKRAFFSFNSLMSGGNVQFRCDASQQFQTVGVRLTQTRARRRTRSEPKLGGPQDPSLLYIWLGRWVAGWLTEQTGTAESTNTHHPYLLIKAIQPTASRPQLPPAQDLAWRLRGLRQTDGAETLPYAHASFGHGRATQGVNQHIPKEILISKMANSGNTHLLLSTCTQNARREPHLSSSPFTLFPVFHQSMILASVCWIISTRMSLLLRTGVNCRNQDLTVACRKTARGPCNHVDHLLLLRMPLLSSSPMSQKFIYPGEIPLLFTLLFILRAEPASS